MAHFILLKTNTNAKELAKQFLHHIWRLHGLPESIVSDRNTKVDLHFWKRLMELLDVKVNMSIAFHPESDGQTERVNQTLEQYLRYYCSWRQNDWGDLPVLAEFAYNSTQSETTGQSPFYANYGWHPQQAWTPTSNRAH